MIFIKDTQNIEDSCEFGELLRDWAFVPDKFGGDYGCYSTFQLLDEFEKVETTESLKDFLVGKVSTWTTEEERNGVSCFYSKKSDIWIAWYWDGDGSLYIQEGKRAALNTDCKKNYTWDFVTPICRV